MKPVHDPVMWSLLGQIIFGDGKQPTTQPIQPIAIAESKQGTNHSRPPDSTNTLGIAVLRNKSMIAKHACPALCIMKRRSNTDRPVTDLPGDRAFLAQFTSGAESPTAVRNIYGGSIPKSVPPSSTHRSQPSPEAERLGLHLQRYWTDGMRCCAKLSASLNVYSIQYCMPALFVRSASSRLATPEARQVKCHDLDSHRALFRAPLQTASAMDIEGHVLCCPCHVRRQQGQGSFRCHGLTGFFACSSLPSMPCPAHASSQLSSGGIWRQPSRHRTVNVDQKSSRSITALGMECKSWAQLRFQEQLARSVRARALCDAGTIRRE